MSYRAPSVKEPTSIPRYKFRPGALDSIMRSRGFRTEEQLALYIGVRQTDLARLRAGTPVTAEVALRVSALQGDSQYMSCYFDTVHPVPAACAS